MHLSNKFSLYLLSFWCWLEFYCYHHATTKTITTEYEFMHNEFWYSFALEIKIIGAKRAAVKNPGLVACITHLKWLLVCRLIFWIVTRFDVDYGVVSPCCVLSCITNQDYLLEYSLKTFRIISGYIYFYGW